MLYKKSNTGQPESPAIALRYSGSTKPLFGWIVACSPSFSLVVIHRCQLLLNVKYAQSMVGLNIQIDSSTAVYDVTQIDSLDTGSNKSAIVACNKLLKKHPQNELVKVRCI